MDCQLEWRFKEDGSFDELVITDSNGNCILHIEDLGDGRWYQGIYLNYRFRKDAITFGPPTEPNITVQCWFKDLLLSHQKSDGKYVEYDGSPSDKEQE